MRLEWMIKKGKEIINCGSVNGETSRLYRVLLLVRQ